MVPVAMASLAAAALFGLVCLCAGENERPLPALVCNGTVTGIINESYGCAGVYNVDSEGVCTTVPLGTVNPSGPDSCSAFCQETVRFAFGTEAPFPDSYCQGPMECKISNGSLTTVRVANSYDKNLQEIIEAGASFPFGTTEALGRSTGNNVTLAAGSCGYFSFIPVYRTVSGSLTRAQGRCRDALLPSSCVCEETVNYGMIEGTDLVVKSPGGTVAGHTIFVHTDCTTREPLPEDRQTGVWSLPGVSLDPLTLGDLFDTWKEMECHAADVDNLHWRFNITGRGFAARQLGTYGYVIRSLMSRCSVVESWDFKSKLSLAGDEQGGVKDPDGVLGFNTSLWDWEAMVRVEKAHVVPTMCVAPYLQILSKKTVECVEARVKPRHE